MGCWATVTIARCVVAQPCTRVVGLRGAAPLARRRPGPGHNMVVVVGGPKHTGVSRSATASQRRRRPPPPARAAAEPSRTSLRARGATGVGQAG